MFSAIKHLLCIHVFLLVTQSLFLLRILGELQDKISPYYYYQLLFSFIQSLVKADLCLDNSGLLSNHSCFSLTPLARSGKPPATPATVEVLDSENRLHTLQVQVLGTEETWQTPSLLLATTGSGPGAGKIVFSQARVNSVPMTHVMYMHAWWYIMEIDLYVFFVIEMCLFGPKFSSNRYRTYCN